MARQATFVWTSPPPTAVDEVLVIDGEEARLVVRRPRRVSATVGCYVARPSAGDIGALVAAGPGPVTFHVHPPDTDAALLALREVAERVAELCLATPRATVTFAAVVTQVAGAVLSGALLAVAEGTDPVAFQLRPDASVVHLSGAEGEITWSPMPTPETGFVTAAAEGIGGLGIRARLSSGDPAGIAFEVPDAPGATTFAIEVAGTLSDSLPDEPQPAPFAVRTPEATIPR